MPDAVVAGVLHARLHRHVALACRPSAAPCTRASARGRAGCRCCSAGTCRSSARTRPGTRGAPRPGPARRCTARRCVRARDRARSTCRARTGSRPDRRPPRHRGQSMSHGGRESIGRGSVVGGAVGGSVVCPGTVVWPGSVVGAERGVGRGSLPASRMLLPDPHAASNRQPSTAPANRGSTTTAHPFTAPAVRPRTSWRWKTSRITKMGSATMTVPAMTRLGLSICRLRRARAGRSGPCSSRRRC